MFVIAILRWDFGNHYIHYRFELKGDPTWGSHEDISVSEKPGLLR